MGGDGTATTATKVLSGGQGATSEGRQGGTTLARRDRAGLVWEDRHNKLRAGQG